MFNGIIWALFGNDEGGIYGENDAWGAGRPRTFKTAVLWWLRNPLHNLFWHVLDWPSENAFVLYDTDRGWFYHRKPQQWLDSTPHFQTTLLPPFIGWRAAGWQSYIGFRDPEGLLGWTPLKRKS